MYMVQDERELAYMYAGPDAVYCIGGREIRTPVPGGMKVFIDRDLITQQNNQIQQMKQNYNSEQDISNINQRLDNIEKIISQLQNKVKEESSNEKSKGNGNRNFIKNE